MYRFIGTVPVTQRGPGGHMGPPLRGMWEVIPFNRHRRLSKRGSPRTATPTAFIGGNPKQQRGPPGVAAPTGRVARTVSIKRIRPNYAVGAATPGGPHAVSFVYRKPQRRPTGSNTPPLRRHPFFRKRGRGNKDAALRAAFILKLRRYAAQNLFTPLSGKGG